MNDEIFVVDGKRYLFHDTLFAFYGEPVDKNDNPVNGVWIALPKNEIFWLLIDWSESLRGLLEWRWLYFCVIGAVVGAIVLSMSGAALIEAVTNGAAIRDFAYFGFYALIGLIDFVVCGGSLLHEIRNPRQRAEEEEPEE